MKPNAAFARYRAVDLLMFGLMLAVFETVAVTAATRWFPGEPYTVSMTPVVTAIVMMRWGPWAALHAALGGAAFCRASGAQGMHYAIYCVGNLLSMAALLLRKRLTPEGIRQSTAWSLGFAGAVTLLMQCGRALMAVIFGVSPATALGFFTTDAITLLFTLVLTWVVRRLDGLFEDQRHYLLRAGRQDEEEDYDER